MITSVPVSAAVWHSRYTRVHLRYLTFTKDWDCGQSICLLQSQELHILHVFAVLWHSFLSLGGEACVIKPQPQTYEVTFSEQRRFMGCVSLEHNSPPCSAVATLWCVRIYFSSTTPCSQTFHRFLSALVAQWAAVFPVIRFSLEVGLPNGSIGTEPSPSATIHTNAGTSSCYIQIIWSKKEVRQTIVGLKNRPDISFKHYFLERFVPNSNQSDRIL